MSILKPKVNRAFLPLLKASRYKGAHGGRGSGKSHFFADLLITTCASKQTRAVCIREIQKSIAQSVKLLLEDKIRQFGLGGKFRILDDRIETPYDGVITFQGMQNHTADSIKSLEGYDIAWFEEAQRATQKSLKLLRPTIRKPGSELWFSWNPDSEDDPIEQLLRGPTRIKEATVIEANWRHNHWFGGELEKEMLIDRERDYDNYLHVWEGHYIVAHDGAVFADEMRASTAGKRITSVPHVEAKPVDVYFDLGEGDGCAVWYEQQIGFEHHFIDYHYEHHKKLGYHIAEMQKRPYQYKTIWLPHDADYDLLGQDKTIKEQVQAAFPNAEVRIVEAAGKAGSIKQGINLARTIFSACYFDKEKCADGLKALRHWHFKKDEQTGKTSNTPFHDWSSHGGSAFMYFAMAAEEITQVKRKAASGGGGWMG